MRRLYLAALLGPLLIGCSERENLTFDDELRNLSDQSQIFTITNVKVDTITGKNGSTIIIQPNTFVFDDGQVVRQSIQIELREVFDKSEMILNGLGTVSDGRLLESFGMIFLKASSDKRDLSIKEGCSIAVSIPYRKGGFAGELFYGEESGETLNWKYAEATDDTFDVIATTITGMSDQLDSVRRVTYRYVNGVKQFVSDTSFITKYLCCQDSVWNDSADDVTRPYEFSVNKLGWINCDRFINVSDKLDLKIGLKAFNQPIAYLVFRDINAIMEVLFNSEGEAIAARLPRNYKADLVILDKIGDNFMWAKQSIIIGSTKKLTASTRKLTVDKLKRELKGLDK